MSQVCITVILHTRRNLTEDSGRKMLNKAALGMTGIYTMIFFLYLG